MIPRSRAGEDPPTDRQSADLSQGSCFGFGVRSPLPLRYLREGSGTPLRIGEVDSADDDPRGGDPEGSLLYEWTPRPGQRLHARAYSNGQRDSLWIAEAGWFRIEAGVPAIRVPALPEGGDPAWREALLWG
ncbi:MAG: hypothetical protein ACRDF0_10890, partial [Candidatus Limnocylindria bacterium]